MRTYIYRYYRGKQDPNGNPRHWVDVYRVKRNDPELVMATYPVEYLGERGAVRRVIALTENKSVDQVKKDERNNKIRVVAIG